MEANGRGVHSVEKAVLLLDCLWKSGGCLTLGQLAQMTGWAKSTIHGLLRAMVSTAIVEQDPADGTYRLGYHLFELGSSTCTNWKAVAVIRPHMERAAQQIGQSLVLARRCGDDLIVVSRIRPSGGMEVSQPGTRLRWQDSSQGKCILAHMDPAEAARLLLRASPENGDAIWEKLRTQMTLIRELGYTIERAELLPGLQSIGAPIFGADGSCRYALSVVQPLRSWQTGLDRSDAACIRDAAMMASRDLRCSAES